MNKLLLLYYYKFKEFPTFDGTMFLLSNNCIFPRTDIPYEKHNQQA